MQIELFSRLFFSFVTAVLSLLDFVLDLISAFVLFALSQHGKCFICGQRAKAL